MSDIKSRVQNIDPNVSARSMRMLTEDTNNIYLSLNVINTRARYLNDQIKSELNSKLEEFTTPTEVIEEFVENKEQIELSKFYEKLANPVLIATEEFLHDQLNYRKREPVAEDEDDLLEV